jgi:hypothetical protein
MSSSTVRSVCFYLVFFWLIIAAQAWGDSAGDMYLVGVGMSDITGPAAEVTMGGFAVSDQKTTGISTRLCQRRHLGF